MVRWTRAGKAGGPMLAAALVIAKSVEGSQEYDLVFALGFAGLVRPVGQVAEIPCRPIVLCHTRFDKRQHR